MRYFRVVGENKTIPEHGLEIGEIVIAEQLGSYNSSTATVECEVHAFDGNYFVEPDQIQEVFKPKSQKFVKLCEDGIGFRKLISGYAYEVLFEDEGEWGYVYQVRELLTDNFINCKVSKNRFEPMFDAKETKEIADIVSGSALGKQISGTHYKGCKIQPIEYIHANNLDYFQGNVVKYVTRHKDKNKEQDVLKAIHYLELILELQYSENSSN